MTLYMNITKSGARRLQEERLAGAVAAIEIPQLAYAPACAGSDYTDPGRALATSLRPDTGPASATVDLMLALARTNDDDHPGGGVRALATRAVPGTTTRCVMVVAVRRTNGTAGIAIVAGHKDRYVSLGALPATHPGELAMAVAGACGTARLRLERLGMDELPAVSEGEELVAAVAAEWLRGGEPVDDEEA